MYKTQMELMQSLGHTSFCSLAGNADPKLSATRKNLKHVRICMSPPDRGPGATKGTDLPSRNGEQQQA